MQVAQFAQYTGNQQLIEYCRERYRSVLLPNQVAPDGSFPLELRRTKPYSYCLFNLDAMATICQILSSPGDDLWTFRLTDGRSMQTAMAFMFPHIADKHTWPRPPDVQYFDQFPVRQPSLLFAGLAYSEPRYLSLWARLNPDPEVEEVIRNYPIRQPVLWVAEQEPKASGPTANERGVRVRRTQSAVGRAGRQADGVAITLSGRCIMRAARPRAGRRRVRAARAPFAPAGDVGRGQGSGRSRKGRSAADHQRHYVGGWPVPAAIFSVSSAPWGTGGARLSAAPRVRVAFPAPDSRPEAPAVCPPGLLDL